jgi:plastocyanin
MFEPMPLTVKAGTTVSWVNTDDEPHTVVSDTGIFFEWPGQCHDLEHWGFCPPDADPIA